nr:hypothetical protein Iba_chr02bCG11350 [Ipomoea batatas]
MSFYTIFFNRVRPDWSPSKISPFRVEHGYASCLAVGINLTLHSRFGRRHSLGR